jgi:hypothetical protein
MGYRDTGIQGYRDTGIQGYRDTGIQGYRDTGIQGYRDTGKRENLSPSLKSFSPSLSSAFYWQFFCP